MRLALLASLALSSSAFGQTAAAQINGQVTDSSGAAIPGAEVVATNSRTGLARQTLSNDSGYFAIPSLEPGPYEVRARKSGFRAAVRSGLELHVNQNAQIDFALTLGEVTESITVRDDAALLETSDAALGAVVDNTKVINLPLNGRNPFDLVLLTPGTQVYSRGALPGNTIPLSNFSTNGGPAMTNEILLDGIPNTTVVQNELVVIPSVDATQEFKVQTNSIKAEFGRTGGGVINVSLRSGSNQFHGALFEFLRNNVFDSNNWFNNRSGVARPAFRFNQFGGTIGGPIRRDRTFFFFNYEGIRRIQGRTTVFTVPRNDMRDGNFSQLRDAAGRLVEIYDPRSTRLTPDGRNRVRDPFPNNSIPTTTMDPVARRMLEFWARPTQTGNPLTGANNFLSTAGEDYRVNQFNTRIDHALTAKHQLFGRISWDGNLVAPPNVFGNIANPSSGPQRFRQRNLGLSDTWTISPTLVATMRAGASRLLDQGEPYGLGFDIQSLGLPASYAAAQQARQFPQISVTGMTIANLGFGTSALGAVDNSLIDNTKNTYSAQTDLTWVRGRHVFKAGADARVFRVHGTRPTNGAGTFNFTPAFTQGPDPTRAGPNSGNAFASFLLGIANGGNIATQPTQDFQQYYTGFFFQDDIKLSKRLTINPGFRYEIESYRNDRYDRLNFLDFASPSPLRAPGLNVRGGLAFSGVNGNPRAQAATSFHNWGPRIGFAWQPAANLAVRGGYGIFYVPRGWRGIGFAQDGFSATTPHVSSIDGFTPVNFLRNPFPDGFIAPTGSSLGLLTQAGQGITSLEFNQASPYVQQWNLSVQKTLRGQWILETAYAASKGTRIMQNLGFNQIADEYLVRGNDLLRQVPNPFLGQIPASTTLGRATIAEGQLLRPYPHFTAFGSLRSTSGSSSYHSLQLRLERRFSRGFTLLTAYTFSKLMDDGSPGGETTYMGESRPHQNFNNRRLERSLSSQNVPHRFVTSAVYDLPFRAGGRLQHLVGGWQVNGIVTLQDGISPGLATASNPTLGAVGSGALRPDTNGRPAARTGPVADRLDQYFDTTVFSQPAAWRFGNTSRTMPDVRTPGIVNVDFSLLKNIRAAERANLQFRVETFNTFNNTNFGLPAITFGAPGFGAINSASPARIIQLGLKLYY